MDGRRLQGFWNQEVLALLAVYRQFETLLPSPHFEGAEHRGEDGRYVEALLRNYLQKYLPKDLEVLTGFILRPAVKTGKNTRNRKNEADQHSTQLDIIVYDTGTYPVFQRMGETAIVPPEGVIAVLSVKKTLRDADLSAECRALATAGHICRSDEGQPEDRRRGPFLALVGAGSQFADKLVAKETKIFQKLQDLYADRSKFDDMVGFIGDLSGWYVFKARPTTSPTADSGVARYFYLSLEKDELHHSFQFLISGILSVYYDDTRRNVKRPGYTAFPAMPAQKLGGIPFKGLR
ncbi:hypothetical protein RGQ15_10135 [Paracoccus sp. MBLB3053]|uniref:DUF6602 domain-containing protein n=1 Tax=Paracoccus aurantius TaxID=3073814 RepID=A0ABU2HS87_9RHOB|nr:DUF6602 domain-containing protein [Paracoccus sp. MBLB3053]MDS9467924.1 hypothetical protein [Paracoccus sp. MBLB3053]